MKNSNSLLYGVADGTEFCGVARILSRRKIGRICFCDARFMENQVQLNFNDSMIHNYQEVVNSPIGSLFHVRGRKIVTNSGTPSLRVTEAKLIFSFRGFWPDKYHGLTQVTRYRRRTHDLLSNAKSFFFFKKISGSLSAIRKLLYDQSFHEFMTGVLQVSFEGGRAHAFSTTCRANDKEYYLSLTSELKLKRLIAAGFERVFEIGQSFRNEGIDSTHSPEFTMLEIYQAGVGCQNMMELLEELISEVIYLSEGSYHTSFFKENDGSFLVVNYKRPFARLSFHDAFLSIFGEGAACNLKTLIALHPELFNEQMSRFTWLMKVIEKFIVPNILEPTFLTDLPAGMSPFVKEKNDGLISERAFLISQGLFLADIYTDENDYDKLSTALKKQSGELGSELNSEYLEVIAMGMPKTAGIGLGLNRLFMLMLNDLPNNIKETILYPML